MQFKEISYFFLLFVLALNIDLPVNAKENLGKNINSDCIELNPVITADGKTLFFCRSNCKENYGGDDIWISTKDASGNWTPAINIGEPLNDKANNFVSSISGDGNELLLGNVYENRHIIEQGISISRRSSEGWSFPENQTIKDFYNNDESNSFWLSYSGKNLLMTVKRDDSFGKKDIYVSHRIDENIWSKPINLGAVVNSAEDEITPYLAADGRTLYFSSKGHEGFGGMDVFMSRRLDTTWTNWSEPLNLGDEINTPEWDAYYKLSAKGDFAYYVASVGEGNTDIFKVKVPSHIQPLAVALYSGKIKSAKSFVAVHADITYKDLAGGGILGHFSSSIVDGKYDFVLPMNKVYEITIEAATFRKYRDTLDLSGFSDYVEVKKDFFLHPLSDSVMLIKNVLLPTGIAEPKRHEVEHLMNVVNFIIDNENYMLEIVGHTDNVGSENNNLRLSIARAKNATKFFVENGVAEDRILFTGKGEAEPIADNSTKEGRELNRRVELFLIRR